MSGERKHSDIDAEAADWVVRLDGRTPTTAEQRSLEEWLEKDVRHLGAYARARAVYLRFDRMRAATVSARPETEAAPTGFNPTRRKMLLWAAGGTLAAAVSGLTLLRQASVQEYSTRIGEMRRESLPDGSSITLNTGTTLAVSYTERLREVKLICGEVLIEAAADPLRLFKLDVQGTSITTAAAAFAVRLLKHEGMQVMVQQGQVQVFEPSSRIKAVTLPANTLALPPVAVGPQDTDAPLVAEPIDPAEVDRRLAWQRGQLSFEDVTLDYALQEFARYGAVRVVIDDPSIATLKVVGLYSSSDPIGFARTVSVSLGLRLEMRAGVAHLKAA
jgi:transmembrane sensor